MNQNQETFSIADLAKMFRVTARTIRFYEDQGLIFPIRNGQTRIYSRSDRARLAWILRGKSVGFSLADIAEMLSLYNLQDGHARQREVTLEKCKERIAALEAQRNDINATIAELTQFCDDVESLETDPATGALLDSKTGEPVSLQSYIFSQSHNISIGT